ncbi:hypothetical protein [Bradyrhizobium sp. SZCCHNR1093]|uniref:hypothetical protein n=1 Tax=Bradyrhizobium sp. SZCCHNR1093 TaxID=3057368 RepID=UPI0028E76421|nr:hypothetical protein [Bradyrhizobium sp. SZCCHNR1093]
MARETKEITLKKPFADGKGGTVTKIVLQEPSAQDFFKFGPVQTWVRAAGGMALVDEDAAIAAYTERAIIEPNPLLAMSQMSLLDAIAVREALLGFFRESAPAPAQRENPPT